ncbi:MAG: ABC transporter ATP-binding protein [Planctomycetota bacterium]|nr:MAG: ABC transporter ATP-binding protein [Planctomycetota bacterium]RLS97093.1 MAG: ABC transporter ATP-binding protein [Planctomycetota bacterium]
MKHDVAPRTGSSSARFRRYRDELTRRAREKREDARGKPKGALQRSFGALIRAYLGLLAPYRPQVTVAFIALAIATSLALIPPAGIKIAIDSVFGDQPLPPIVQRWAPSWINLSDRSAVLALVAGVTLITIMIKVCVSLVGRTRATVVAKLLQVALRRRAFAKAIHLPLARVHELKAGGVASLIREDAGAAGELLFGLLYNPFRAVIQLTGSLIILAWTDWRLLVGAIVLLPMVWFSHRTWVGRIRPIYRDLKKLRDEIDGHASESFSGIRVVRGFAREEAEAARFARGTNLQARTELLVWWWSRGVEIAWELFIPMATAGLLWYGGMQVVNGRLTAGDLVMFLTYVTLLLGPLEVLANTATNLQTGLASLDRTLDLLGEEDEFAQSAARATLKLAPAQVRGDVRFDDVSFHYAGSERLVLDGVSFAANAGTTVALVGHSGAGKTTLSNLVARFHDPTRGAVTIDGHDIRDIELASYRRLLGIVEQDVFLFDGSIRENIAYARPDASDAAIAHAAKVARADVFIAKLEEKFDTRIGERGVKLSGGERQRLALARAVLADPRILILDEATSNLDTESERHIQAALGEILRGRTSFVIAHRLSTIREADLILVMEDGKVVERGTHDELIRSSGRYATMVVLQTEPRRDESTPRRDTSTDAHPLANA